MSIKYINDKFTIDDEAKLIYDNSLCRISSKIEFFNDETGEQIWEPLHNKTTIAGAALTAMKLFDFDRSVLNNTPTYDNELKLDDTVGDALYPVMSIKNSNGDFVGAVPDETQRMIMGFCVGQGGAGLDISDVFDVKYASWIEPDDLVPFMYPLISVDNTDENTYKGKKKVKLAGGQERNAYYFKEFASAPKFDQCYVSTLGNFSDPIMQSTVYTNKASADRAQTYVELHLKITKDDCREFFIAHKGLENSKINQISLISAWKRNIERTSLDINGNTTTKTIDVFTHIRPFSLVNIPNEILSDPEKSISIIYTLYF